jgi:hypothetical protein
MREVRSRETPQLFSLARRRRRELSCRRGDGVDEVMEEGMTPVLELPATLPPDRIAAAVGVLARVLARQIVQEISAEEGS